MATVAEEVREAAEEVHSILGPGWTESVYHRAMEHELSDRGIPFSSEGTITVFYKGMPVGRRRPDLFVTGDRGIILVELKASPGTGKEQLIQYIDLLSEDANFTVERGILIQFSKTVEIVESTPK